MLRIENKDSVVLAYLNNALDGTVTEVLNGEYILSFTVTIDHLKTIHLYDPNNYIVFKEDLFKVKSISEIHNDSEGIRIEVECEHISYDLLNTKFNDFIFVYESAITAFQTCLRDTGFTVGNCDIPEKTSIQYTQECNAKQISVAIAANWKGELKYHRHTISLLKSRGQNRGIAFIFGRNLSSIKRNIDFVEDKISYEVDVVKNSELEELAYYELGDTVRVIDEALNVDIELKIVETQTNIVTGLNSVVRLGDTIADLRSSFSKVTDKIVESVEEVKDIIGEGAVNWDRINNILNNNDEIVIGKINELEGRASKIVNSTGTFMQTDSACYWQDQPTKEQSTFASLWGPKGMVYATKKDVKGEWIWTSVFDGEGVIASQVTADALTGITINGVEIVGSSILAGDIKMTGNISWGAENSPVKAQYSIDGFSEWHEIFTDLDTYARYSYDGGKTWTPAVKIVGTDGIQGPKGDQGIQGPKGTDGKTSYFHIKYSPVENPTFSDMTEEPSTFIGTYVDFEPTDSTDPKKYKWVRLEGSQGPKGEQGIPGYNGSDGKTTYLHIKYSNVPNPTSSSQMSETVGDYIGQYTDFEQNDSTDPAKYTWTRIKGDPGLPGQNGSDGQTSYFHVKYAPVPNPTYEQMSEEPNTYIGTYVDFDPYDSNDPSKYKWVRLEGSQGPKGEQGIPGYNGSDGRTTYLHIKYSNVANPTSSSQMSETLGDYIGQYTDFEPNDSTDPKKYTWTRIKGDQGPAGSDANVPSYIKSTYIDSVTIQSPTISGGKFTSYKANGDYMLLDGGQINFKATNGNQGFLDASSMTLFGTNNSFIDIEAYDAWFGSYIHAGSNNHDFTLMNPSYSNKVVLNSDGGIDIEAPTGTGRVRIAARDNYNPIYLEGYVTCFGSLDVWGSKDAVVPTQHYGARVLYCDESDRSYFSTKGLCETVNGECIVDLDPMFMETIELNSSCPYIILLTPYSDARVWIDSVEDHRFVIKSDKNTKVAYDLKAIRISFQNIYMEERKVDNKVLKKVQQAAVERMKI